MESNMYDYKEFKTNSEEEQEYIMDISRHSEILGPRFVILEPKKECLCDWGSTG